MLSSPHDMKRLFIAAATIILGALGLCTGEDGTYITTSFPASLQQDIATNQLSEYVDSFVLSNTLGFIITEGGP